MDAPRSEIQRFHSGLITEKEAKTLKPKYSDHLPIGSQILVRREKDVPIGISLFSWNVWASKGPSGFGLDNESDVDRKARYERIVQSIITLIRTKKPDVITLQETGKLDEDFDKILKKVLAETKLDWGVCNADGLYGMWGLITLYDKKRYKLNVNEVEKSDGMLKIRLITTRKKESLIIHNVHKGHTDLPMNTEEYIQKLFTQTDDNKSFVVVAGDFNTRFAPPIYDPLKKKDMNIITGAVPPGFSWCMQGNTAIQGTDFTDAAFYKSPAISSTVWQASMKTYNPENWKIFDDVININHFPEEQQSEMKRFRVLGRVGPHLSFPRPSKFETDSDIAEFEDIGEKPFSVFDYEKELRQKFSALPEIYVRDAANALNQRTVCVIISKKLLNLIDLKAMQLEEGLLVLSVDRSNAYAGLYAPQVLSLELFKIYIEDALKNIALRYTDINTKIDVLKNKNLTAVQNYMDDLTRLLAQCWVNIDGEYWQACLMSLLNVNSLETAKEIMVEKIKNDQKLNNEIQNESIYREHSILKDKMNQDLTAMGFTDISVKFINKYRYCFTFAPYYLELFKKFPDVSIDECEIFIPKTASNNNPVMDWCIAQYTSYQNLLSQEHDLDSKDAVDNEIAKLYVQTKTLIADNPNVHSAAIEANMDKLLTLLGATTFRLQEYSSYMMQSGAQNLSFFSTDNYNEKPKWKYIEQKITTSDNAFIRELTENKKADDKPSLTLD